MAAEQLSTPSAGWSRTTRSTRTLCVMPAITVCSTKRQAPRQVLRQVVKLQLAWPSKAFDGCEARSVLRAVFMVRHGNPSIVGSRHLLHRLSTHIIGTL